MGRQSTDEDVARVVLNRARISKRGAMEELLTYQHQSGWLTFSRFPNIKRLMGEIKKAREKKRAEARERAEQKRKIDQKKKEKERLERERQGELFK